MGIIRICSGVDIAKAFEVAFNRKIEKNWEKIYVVVDIHPETDWVKVIEVLGRF